MDYKFYQGLVMHQAQKGENPEAGFDEFLEALEGDRCNVTKGMQRLHTVLFPERGGISEDLGLPEMLELINPEKMIPVFELVSLTKVAEGGGRKDEAEARFAAKLEELGIPEERFAEVRESVEEFCGVAELATEFNEKKVELIKAMWIEQAKLYGKYMELFYEALGDKPEEASAGHK